MQLVWVSALTLMTGRQENIPYVNNLYQFLPNVLIWKKRREETKGDKLSYIYQKKMKAGIHLQ